MDRIIRGAAKYNQDGDHSQKAQLRELQPVGQRPVALLITCVDSRLMPSVFTEAAPGEILSLRNVGNLIPAYSEAEAGRDTSVGATLVFALESLNIENIIVLGHSECGGMSELFARREDLGADTLGTWLRHGKRALERMSAEELADSGLTEINRLSQINVLAGLEMLSHYPAVRSRLDKMTLTLHGWWFDIANTMVMGFEPRAGRFVPIEHAYESTVTNTRTDV
jgi:carbonic anhydrase